MIILMPSNLYCDKRFDSKDIIRLDVKKTLALKSYFYVHGECRHPSIRDVVLEAHYGNDEFHW